MKRFYLLYLLLPLLIKAQKTEYYSDIDLNKSPSEIITDLHDLLTDTHDTKLSYTPGVWDALQTLDEDPSNPNNVLLIYGYSNDDQILYNDRSRDKNLQCHQTECTGKWNREHVYPKSIGEFDTNGYAYSDVHALRASDTEMNSLRFNYPYVDGDGASAVISNYRFYPGDEWKGDVARMILYMYLRYPVYCRPNYVGIDSHTYNSNIPDIFLEWNAEDPVSDFEKRRNNLIEQTYQGNRNPFIDNPSIATTLWGGPQAQDLWTNMSSEVFNEAEFKVYPNPTTDKIYYSKHQFDRISIYNNLGQLIKNDLNLSDNETKLPEHPGHYVVQFCKDSNCKSFSIIKK